MLKQTRITGGDIVRDPTSDFKDDGTRFEAYLYKNCIPITRASGTGSDECFIAIDIYEISDDKNNKEEWKLADYFDGVPREMYDRKILLAICEYFYQKYVEKNPNPDMSNLPREFQN